MTLPIVIVGGGLAAVRTAQSLRMSGNDERIILIGDEAHQPYDRPSLSKEVLSGEYHAPPPLVDADWFATAAIETRWGGRVEQIRCAPLAVILTGGEEISARAIVVATGAQDRKLPVPGAALANVVGLRSLDDANALKRMLGGTDHLVVVGGGLIGCEVASTARRLGVDVTVVEAAAAPMMRVLGAELGAMARDWLEGIGVTFIPMATVTAIEGEDRVEAVRLSDGTRIAADIVLVSIGARPRVELVETLGIGGRAGIPVNGYGATTVPGIYAVGDVAQWPLRCGGQRCLETYINTQDQASIVAAALAGQPVSQHQLPYSWTTIAGHKLQIAGDFAAQGTLVFRTLATGGKLAFKTDETGQILATVAIDAPKDFGLAKRLVEQSAVVEPAALSDVDLPLRTLLQGQRAA